MQRYTVRDSRSNSSLRQIENFWLWDNSYLRKKRMLIWYATWQGTMWKSLSTNLTNEFGIMSQVPRLFNRVLRMRDQFVFEYSNLVSLLFHCMSWLLLSCQMLDPRQEPNYYWWDEVPYLCQNFFLRNGQFTRHESQVLISGTRLIPVPHLYRWLPIPVVTTNKLNSSMSDSL